MITSILPQDPQQWQHWQLPVQASTFANDHDNLYMFVEWINYIFFFGIVIILLDLYILPFVDLNGWIRIAGGKRHSVVDRACNCV